ncbi:MAG: hypothetical protein M3P49_17260 [Actinomycetota bacterium]|nr:hypothetical protein [Actinomycetota bacterium]
MLAEIRRAFDALRRLRLRDPMKSLEAVGRIAADCLTLLRDNCDLEEIEWRGKGTKTYRVFHRVGSPASSFSRAIRTELWIGERSLFEEKWTEFLEALRRADEAPGALQTDDAEMLDRLLYTAVIGFGASVDVFGAGDRGGPGTFFEMAVGPTVSLLTGRTETGAVLVPVPHTADQTERVPVDLSFLDDRHPIQLVVPTKISTRERISQAFVHQAILNKAGHGRKYRSVLCIGNENNMFKKNTAAAKSYDNAYVSDTLVPATIVQYQRYIAHLAGLYYLDPPHEYLTAPKDAFPPVKRFSALLTGDLPKLLTP